MAETSAHCPRGWVETRATTEHCAPLRGAALRHLAPPPTRTRAPSPALATRLHGTERILRALVPCCRAYCILDAELSDVIVFAAPRSTPAAARARAPPLLRSNTLNFMALQIRVGAQRSGPRV